MTAAMILALALALPGAPPTPQGPPADPFKPDPAWKALDPKGRTPIWFDPAGHRLIFRARVAVREGALEHLLCARNSKEHESVLATEAPARIIHAGLLLAGAKPGHPVHFRPKFEPPAGDRIAIELQWEQDGKTRTADARQWVRDGHTDKPLELEWVFAGSELYQDQETKQMRYAAEGGDLFTVANFSSAILDLPIASTANDSDRLFVANTPNIPPRDTPVTVILRPAPTPTPARP